MRCLLSFVVVMLMSRLLAAPSTEARAATGPFTLVSHRIYQGPLRGFHATPFPLMAGPGVADVEVRGTERDARNVRLVAVVRNLLQSDAPVETRSGPHTLASGTTQLLSVTFVVPAAAGYGLEVFVEDIPSGTRSSMFHHDGATPRGPALPIGDATQIKPMEGLTAPPDVSIAFPPHPRGVEHARTFEQRGTSAATATLCREFARVVHLDAPGLEEFRRRYLQEDYTGALDAYRSYFFTKLKSPETFGCPTQNLLFHFAHGRSREQLLKRPEPGVVALNLDGVTVSQVELPDLDGTGGKKITVGARVGPPGQVWWAPVSNPLPPGEAFDMFSGRTARSSPFWRSTEGRELYLRLEVARSLRYLPHLGSGWSTGGLFYPLLGSYVTGGPREHLARWCEYFDDYALHATDDYEAASLHLRITTELETQQLQSMLMMLRLTLDSRPELARDFPSTTLARLVMVLARDYLPHLIRARRAEMANWGIMGISYGIQVAEFFPELKAFDYWKRELWRLWRYNMVQHRTLDGETFESFDAGHKGIDVEYAWYALPYISLPADAHPLTAHSFWDHQRTMQRALLGHLSPRGNYWPGNLRVWDKSWAASVPTAAEHLKGYLGGHWLKYRLLDDVRQEPEAAWRINHLLGRPDPAGRNPPPRSNLMPYAATAYLRDRWTPDSPFIAIRSFQDHSQTHPLASNFSLFAGDRSVLSGTPVLVDRKPPNAALRLNKVPTGGKVDFSGQAGRQVVPTRMHTSDQFDLVETRFDPPYSHYAYTDLLLPVDSDAIGHRHVGGRDTRASIPSVDGPSVLRKSIYVSGEEIFIVQDAIGATSGSPRSFAMALAFPEEAKVVVGPDRRSLTSVAADRPNVAVHFFGRAVEFGGPLSRDGSRFQPMDQQESGKPKRLSATWSGLAPQSVVTTFAFLPPTAPNAPTADSGLRDIQELTSPRGQTRISATTRRGSSFWLDASSGSPQALEAGPVSADAELLLVIKRGGSLHGMVLGASHVRHGTFAPALPGSDFEFVVDPRGHWTTTAIHRPIDTVKILPEQTCFTNSLTVTLQAPPSTDKVELRYTTDGSDPTPSSQLYTGPFTLETTTLIKVRPLRQGLTELPMDAAGPSAGKTVSALFLRQDPLPAIPAPTAAAPGLRARYYEGPWMELFAYAGSPDVLTPRRTTSAASLLEPNGLSQLRTTDGAYAVVYDGTLSVPSTGVYTFHAPEHLYTATLDAGFDLRVFIDEHEWMPNPDLHAENAWSVALAAGPHRLRVAFVDYRQRPFRNEYWMAWWPGQIWQGIPTLEMSGPGHPRQSIPGSWLHH